MKPGDGVCAIFRHQDRLVVLRCEFPDLRGQLMLDELEVAGVAVPSVVAVQADYVCSVDTCGKNV